MGIWSLRPGRSPGEGNGNPLHHSCLENPMDRGAWQATVHRSQRVSSIHQWYHFICGGTFREILADIKETHRQSASLDGSWAASSTWTPQGDPAHWLSSLSPTYLRPSLNLFSSQGQTPVPSSYFPGGSDGKAFADTAGDPGSIPGLGRSPGEGNGNPLPYSCLEKPMDGGTWWATVHGVTKSRTWLSNITFTFFSSWS